MQAMQCNAICWTLDALGSYSLKHGIAAHFLTLTPDLTGIYMVRHGRDLMKLLPIRRSVI